MQKTSMLQMSYIILNIRFLTAVLPSRRTYHYLEKLGENLFFFLLIQKICCRSFSNVPKVKETLSWQ